MNIIKNKFKHLSKTIGLLLFLFSTNHIFGQWAGKDTVVVIDPNQPLNVTIGMPNPDNRVCYTWSCSQAHQVITTNIHQPQVTVQIDQSGIYTYQVKRVSKNGVEEDEVKVDVRDCILLARFEPKVECFNENQEVLRTDFYIETDPPGYEGNVSITPIKTPTNSTGNEVQSRVFTATIECENDPGFIEFDTCSVNVVKNSPVTEHSTTFGVVDAIERAIDIFCKAEKNPAVKKTTSFFDKFGNSVLGKAIPCSPSFSMDVTAATTTPEEFCCEGTIQHGTRLNLPSVTLSAGVNCAFPVPLPGLSMCKALRMTFSIKGGVQFGPYTGVLLTLDNSCGTDELDVAFFLEVAGGVMAGLPNVEEPAESLIGVKGEVVASLPLNCKWKLGDGLSIESLSLNLKLVGTAYFLGSSDQISYDLCTIYF